MKKEVIAVVLVGGKGTRLKSITKKTTKPAISIFAKYKLIDFTLSNISGSGIDTVGIVTQYEPYDLMNYISSGASWDFNVVDGGISFLTPFQTSSTFNWQKGTAHAVKQHINFITGYNPNYVLIVPGDHVYRMNYSFLIDEHIKNKAALTIVGTTNVSDDLSRYGIIEIDENKKILGFEEKPKKPKSNFASMGIYLFNLNVLTKYLAKADELVDFGKDIIPYVLKERNDVFMYEYKGFWRDVGTVESLYKTNFELLDNIDLLLNKDLSTPSVYSKSLNLAPHIFESNGKVTNSVIGDGSWIDGEIRHSIISVNCEVHSRSIIEDCLLMPNVLIQNGVKIKNCIVNENLVIPEDTVIISDKIVLVDEEYLKKNKN